MQEHVPLQTCHFVYLLFVNNFVCFVCFFLVENCLIVVVGMSVRRGGAQQEVMYSVNGHLLQVVKELGEGGFATVYAVQDVDSKEQFALKRVVTNDSTQKALVEKEINIMQSIRHPNIIDLVGYSCNPIARGHEYLIQMELCTGGTLLEHIVRRGQRRWGELEILGMFWQVCCAVEVLHSQSPPIAHRDLKTENIILTDRGRWKLIDFGSCTTRAKKYTAAEIHEEELQIQKYSTPMYRAPEMADLYQKQLICEKVDIWALGCILYCMLFLLHPFQEGGSLVILNGCPPLPENTYSQYPKQILKRLFALRVSKRPDIAVVLEYLRKWKRFLEGGGDPEPDFSSHRKRSKSRKSGERKKSSRRAKAEAKTPSDSRTRSRTTGAAPTQADSGSDSASDSEDESRHQKTVAPTKATTAAASATKPKAADDLLDFQWVADWKPFDGSEAASTPAPAPPQASAAKNVPDLLWFNDTPPPQPVIQQRSPPLPVMQQPPMFQPFSASQAYQQALISPPQYGVGQMMYAQQPMYPYGMQQQQPYGMGRPQAAAVRPQSPELPPQLNSRRQTAPPPPSVPQAKPNPPSQAELDFDFAFR